MEFCHTMKSINFLNPFKPFYARFLWICALELKIIGVNMRGIETFEYHNYKMLQAQFIAAVMHSMHHAFDSLE